MPDVLMPRLSDTMAEGVLSQWSKKEGDHVRKGDVLAEIETDKATMELESYDDGVVERLLVAEGTTVPIGAPIAVIGDGSQVGTAQPSTAQPSTAQASTAQPSTGQASSGPASPAAGTPDPALDATRAPAPAPAGSGAAAPRSGVVRTSPLARAIAREHGVDLSTVVGTGPGGRIVRADVDAAVAALAAEPARSAGTPSATAQPVADVEEIPLTANRRVTARRLAESAAVPHFELTRAVDVGRLLEFRQDVNERLAPSGVKISVTDLLVRACAVTLRGHPAVNSSWGGDKLLRHRRVNVGVAVALDDGLIVPVIRDADRQSVSEIGAQARDLAERARSGRLAPDEFSGGTFTISNLGMYGVDSFTAVINPPEAAILAVGAIVPEPVARDGEVVVRPIMRMMLTVDHRVLDGATAAKFLQDLAAALAEPLRMVV